MLKIRLGGIGLDCADPGPLSAFWAELLGGEISFVSEDVTVVKLDHLLLTAYRVEDYKPPTWPQGPVPKQAHIDLDVDDLRPDRKESGLPRRRAGTITAGARELSGSPGPGGTSLLPVDPDSMNDD